MREEEELLFLTLLQIFKTHDTLRVATEVVMNRILEKGDDWVRVWWDHLWDWWCEVMEVFNSKENWDEESATLLREYVLFSYWDLLQNLASELGISENEP